MRRLRARCGIARLHWHLFRHGFAQTALVKGAPPALVQEMLGHSTNVMTRRYLGRARQTEAARQMPKYAPIEGEKNLAHRTKSSCFGKQRGFSKPRAQPSSYLVGEGAGIRTLNLGLKSPPEMRPLIVRPRLLR